MSWRTMYVVLAAIGFLLPYSEFAPWLAENGLRPSLLFSELFSSRIAAFFGYDVFVSALVVFTFIAADRQMLKVRRSWLAVAGTLAVGVSFGLPLYLYLRESAVRDRAVGRVGHTEKPSPAT